MGSAQPVNPLNPINPVNPAQPVNPVIKSGRDLELALMLSKKLISAVQKAKEKKEVIEKEKKRLRNEELEKEEKRQREKEEIEKEKRRQREREELEKEKKRLAEMDLVFHEKMSRPSMTSRIPERSDYRPEHERFFKSETRLPEARSLSEIRPVTNLLNRMPESRSGNQNNPDFLPLSCKDLSGFASSGRMRNPSDQRWNLPDAKSDNISPNFNVRQQGMSDSSERHLPQREELFPSAQNIRPDSRERNLPNFNNPFGVKDETAWEHQGRRSRLPDSREINLPNFNNPFGASDEPSREHQGRRGDLPDLRERNLPNFNNPFGLKDETNQEHQGKRPNLSDSRERKLPNFKDPFGASEEPNWEYQGRSSGLPDSRERILPNVNNPFGASDEPNWEHQGRSSGLPDSRERKLPNFKDPFGASDEPNSEHQGRRSGLPDTRERNLPNFSHPSGLKDETNWEQMSKRSGLPDSRDRNLPNPFNASSSQNLTRNFADSPNFTIPLKINFPNQERRQDLEDWRGMPENLNERNFPKFLDTQTGRNLPNFSNPSGSSGESRQSNWEQSSLPDSRERNSLNQDSKFRSSKLSDYFQGMTNEQHNERVPDKFQDWNSPKVGIKSSNFYQGKVSSQEIKAIPGTFSEQLYSQTSVYPKNGRNSFESETEMSSAASNSNSNFGPSSQGNDILSKAKAKLMAKRMKKEEQHCQIVFENVAGQSKQVNPNSNQDLVNSLDWNTLSQLVASNAVNKSSN